MKCFIVIAACILGVSGVSPAQSALNSRPSDKSAADPQSSTDKPTPENGRVFGLMPNYGTVDSTHVAPMSAADKFKLALRYIDPYTFGVVAFRAGIEQATNSKEEYGQGMEGYGKRYGADFADGLTNSFFVTGVFPSLLHQDPRYFRRGQGAFLSRASYAASRVLITRQDSGRKFFNFSEVLGNAASAGISQAYYPESERTMGDFAVRTGVQFGFDAGFNVVKEFYPDVVRKLFKKKSQRQSPGQSAN